MAFANFSGYMETSGFQVLLPGCLLSVARLVMEQLDAASAARVVQELHVVGRIYGRLHRRQHGPSRRIRALAILIWFFSKNPDMAAAYLLIRCSDSVDETQFRQGCEIVALTLLDWFRDAVVVSIVFAAIDALDHPVHVMADNFLMQTRLVEFIVAQNMRGLTVALPEAVEVYLRLVLPCHERGHSTVFTTSGLASQHTTTLWRLFASLLPAEHYRDASVTRAPSLTFHGVSILLHVLAFQFLHVVRWIALRIRSFLNHFS